MKTCKIYCTYFGTRRGIASASPANADETLSVLKLNINNDIIMNSGVENMDVIIINNQSNEITNECEEYLKSLNNKKIPSGKIMVFNRENKGGSLGAYSYAFDLFENDYDFWFFCEDDLITIYPRYYEIAINEFSDEKLGFLALTSINFENNLNRKHVSGGVGVSTKEILKKVKKKFGKLPYDERNNLINYAGVGQSETLFTNCYLGLGYEVRIPLNDEVIPIADNWEAFPPQRVWQEKIKFDTNKKFLWHIGL